MSKKYTCYIIHPIGENESQSGRDSQMFHEFVIKPMLTDYGFELWQDEPQDSHESFDNSIFSPVQTADICIADVSTENLHVYYQLGIRNGCRKPLVLLKSDTTKGLPFNIDAKCIIAFDIQNPRTWIETKQQLEETVKGLVNEGFKRQSETSLDEINKKLDRLERSIVHLLDSHSSNQSDPKDESWNEVDPEDLLKSAMIERSVEKAEFAMKKLQYSMDPVKFYDIVVEATAGLGSRMAGKMLIDKVDWFMIQSVSLKKKIEYLGSLVSYLNRTDQEIAYRKSIEDVASRLIDEHEEAKPSVYNQLNRLYYGIYQTNKDIQFVEMALDNLKKAIAISPDDASYHYNLATCYNALAQDSKDDVEKQKNYKLAAESVSRSIELDGDDQDADHLSLGCRIMYQLNDNRWRDYLASLETVSPVKAQILKRRFKI